MKRTFPLLVAGALAVAPAVHAATIATLQGFSVPAASFATGGCVQVPVFLFEGARNNLDLRDLVYTLSISDPDGVIAGGISTNVIVANGFKVGGSVGLTNPATDLSSPAGGTPACAPNFIANPVTQGVISPVDFAQGINPSTAWFVNNNSSGLGHKQAFVIDLGLNQSLAVIPQSTQLLIGVLEIPIISNPPATTITVQFVIGTDNNTVTYDIGGQVNEVLGAGFPADVILTPPIEIFANGFE